MSSNIQIQPDTLAHQVHPFCLYLNILLFLFVLFCLSYIFFFFLFRATFQGVMLVINVVT